MRRVLAVSVLTVFLVLAGMSLVAASAPAAALGHHIGLAQQGPCFVSASEVEPGVIEISVEPPVGISFIQSPGFEFVVVDAGGVVRGLGNRRAGAVGPVRFTASNLTQGATYLINATLVSTCSTSVTLAVRSSSVLLPRGLQPGLDLSIEELPQLSQPDFTLANVLPVVAVLDCPTFVLANQTYTVTGTASDFDGAIVATWWELPTGDIRPGTQITLTGQEMIGAKDLLFGARDNRGGVNSAACRPTLALASTLGTPTAVPTATPIPTATAVPEPTATTPPAPTATTPPAPTPVPRDTPVPGLTVEPEPTSDPDPTPEPEPTEQPAAEPTAGGEPTAGPEPTSPVGPGDPDRAPIGEPEQGDQNAGSAATQNNPAVIPAVLEAEWPEPMIVDEVHTFTVRLVGKDWRPDADEFDDDGQIVTIDEDSGTKTHEIAVYGVEGPVTLRLEVNPDELEIVDPGGTDDDPPPSAQRVVRLQRGTRPAAVWHLKPVRPGQATVKIVTDAVVTAVPSDFLDDDELALLKIDEVAEPIELQVQARTRTTWHDLRLLHALPLVLLPWLPVGELTRTSLRRRPEDDSESGGARQPHHPRPSGGDPWASGDVGLVLSGGGFRATGFSVGVAMYVADANRWAQVRQIASVSGGSLTNAFVTDRASKLDRMPVGNDFASLPQAVATKGLSIERGIRILAVAMVLGAAWIAAIVTWAAPSLFAALPWVIVGSLLWCLLCWLAFVWLGLRPGLQRWIPRFVGISRDLALGDLGRGARHRITSVFTSTTLRSRHAHLSQGQSVIASDNLDREIATDNQELDGAVVHRGEPAGISVAQAVQASAAFPGLPHVVMNADAAGFGGVEELGRKLVLRDGGTVDNLGHLSQTLFATQSDELAQFLTGNGAIQTWVVVDSSAHRTVSKRRPEFVNRILRALHLGAAADLAEMAGSGPAKRVAESAARMKTHFADTGAGVYLALRDSPYDYARDVLVVADEDNAGPAIEAFMRDGKWPVAYAPTAAREQAAQRALEHLARSSLPENPDQDWSTQSQRCTVTETTLSSLGPKRTNDLVRHGYALAATLCHIELGWHLPAAHDLAEARFAQLLAGDIPPYVAPSAPPAEPVTPPAAAVDLTSETPAPEVIEF